MRKAIVLCAVLVGLSCNLAAQTQAPKPLSDLELNAISTRGRALAEYDSAAWHSSDAVVPLNPSKDTVQLYVARKTESGWVVMWGRFNDSRTKFLIAYEALQLSHSQDYTVIQHDPPLEDGDVYLRAAKAHEIAHADFLQRAHAPLTYNMSVLPSESGGWYVYCIPAQTENAVLPFGADIRYTISRDGETITETRQMHETLLERGTAKVQLGVHSHVLSDLPEDSDVFYAMSVKGSLGDWVVAKDFVYGISPDGSMRFLGKNEEVAKMLEDGKFPEITEPFRSMTKTFVEAGSGLDPVVVFASLSGARCEGKTLYLKFSILINNRTGTRLILNRRALWNAQFRFGASASEILAGKYEKTVFVVPDKTDYSDMNAFLPLDPGMILNQEREYPVIGLNFKGKSAFQLLFFTWPPLETDQIDAQRSRLAQYGHLFTDDIATPPAPLMIDRGILESCPAD